MSSRILMVEGDRPSIQSEEKPFETEETAIVPERDINWIGMAFVGILLILTGMAALSTSGSLGAGVIFLGFLMLIGSRTVKRWVEDVEASSDMDTDMDYEWQQEEDDARAIEQELQARRAARQKEIDEIVKAVKSTIRVRCQYCGTLNEETANKCETCGASL